MPLVTFTSDYGLQDHYVAAVKAKLLNADITTQIVDISHLINPLDVAHGAFIIKNVYKDFPKGSIHFVAVGTTAAQNDRFVAVEINQHFFVAPDNGILSMINNGEPLKASLFSENIKDSFPAKNIMAEAVIKLRKNQTLDVFDNNFLDYKETKNRVISFKDDNISGHIIHIDYYGNAITNISEDIFQAVRHDRSYTISFKRENINRIYHSYNEVGEADCVTLFNAANLLEIAIKQGSAYQLLGLRFGDAVNILFQ